MMACDMKTTEAEYDSPELIFAQAVPSREDLIDARRSGCSRCGGCAWVCVRVYSMWVQFHQLRSAGGARLNFPMRSFLAAKMKIKPK